MFKKQKIIKTFQWIFSYFSPAITVFVPFIIYFGIRSIGFKYLFSGLLLLYILRLVYSLRKGITNNQIFIFTVIIVLLCCTVFFNRASLALYTPALINLGLLLSFGSTLFIGPPIIETFARKQRIELSDVEIKYCRKLTVIWSVFFIVNGGVSVVISLGRNMDSWIFYNGFLSYIMIGLLFSIEMTYRYYRFRNYGNTFIDNFYKRIFKPREFQAKS